MYLLHATLVLRRRVAIGRKEIRKALSNFLIIGGIGGHVRDNQRLKNLETKLEYFVDGEKKIGERTLSSVTIPEIISFANPLHRSAWTG